MASRKRKAGSQKIKVYGEGTAASSKGQILNRQGMHKFRVRTEKSIQDRLRAGTEEDRQILNAIRDMPEYSALDAGDICVDDILDGTVPIELSHAGGEFQQLLEDDLRPKGKKHADTRTRRNRVLLRNQGFISQMEAMVDAYLNWSEALGVSGKGVAAPLSTESITQGTYPVQVVDVYGKLRTNEIDAIISLFFRNIPCERTAA
ncbi:hypothetical protein Hypma_011938 [Hypsizygus marmoreus]|uniref:Uncharacterized protein n=1 Tax=Hypsizygus marmoreus TaxID=39966 RepID=A0A369JJM3_HYPMA|nr:hypothetical protein Hypma_011938 [Hypsizygus marmoreus]